MTAHAKLTASVSASVIRDVVVRHWGWIAASLAISALGGLIGYLLHGTVWGILIGPAVVLVKVALPPTSTRERRIDRDV